MKRTTIVIIIQSVFIAILLLYAFVQQTFAEKSRLEAVLQHKIAMETNELAHKQRIVAEQLAARTASLEAELAACKESH